MSRPAADPLFRSARREALISLAAWLAAVAYTVTYCYRFGYDRNLESLTFVLWFPDWIFWGIVVPWLVCVAFSTWFAFGLMRDEDLDANDGGASDDADDEATELRVAQHDAAHDRTAQRGPSPGDAHA